MYVNGIGMLCLVFFVSNVFVANFRALFSFFFGVIFCVYVLFLCSRY